MRKVLLDACVPRLLLKELRADFAVDRAQDVGLDTIPDDQLLDACCGRYDVLVTRDRNLVYQQRIVGRSFAVAVLRTKEQSPAAFISLVPVLKHAIRTAMPGSVTIVGV